MNVVTKSFRYAKRYMGSKSLNTHEYKKQAHRANRHRIKQELHVGKECVSDKPRLTSWDII